ncbi:hypothetical protein NE615_25640, partial [Escherichia coli]|uniref:hypothetical protein n=1 Tax=Escherichia coli TaxID=562 RepID=UPI00210D0429
MYRRDLTICHQFCLVNIIGVGSCPSRGMDKGGVNDLESVVKCVQRAIDQA